MAYIYLDDLKRILPGILDQWVMIDESDWELIFNEIEQKCHVGKKKKDKKKWKTKIESMVDTHSADLSVHRFDINVLTKRVDELSNKVSNLSNSNISMAGRINHISKDITAAKSMAETAKQRTEVNYDQISKAKNDAEVVQDVYNRMAGRGATREELDGFRDLIHKYDALEKKEIPISHCNSEDKDCKTCKYYCGEEAIDEPCIACDAYQCWEAKNNG